MRPWQLLAVLLLGAARSSFQASVQTHVRPWGGGDAIQPIQHDVELVVKPGPVGPTLLNFMTFGEDGGVFSWANMNNGTLRLERFGQTLFEVARKVEAPDGVGVLLQEASEPSERLLLEQAHATRLRRRAARALLQQEPQTADDLPAPLVATSSLGPEDLADLIAASGEFRVTGSVASTASGSVMAYGTPQWKMILHEDFHKGTVEGWRNSGAQQPLPADNGVSTCTYHPHANSDFYLGNYGNMEAGKTFLLPAHTRVRVRARFHFFDKWEGESAFLKLDGQAVWTQSYQWCDELLETLCRPRDGSDPEDSALAVNVCGHKEFPDKLSTLIDVTLPHSSDVLQLAFGASVRSNDATWGVDDVQVYVS